MKLFINRGNLLFLITLGILLLPSQRSMDAPWAYVAVLILIEAAFLLRYRKHSKKSLLDIVSVSYAVLGFWDLMSRLNLTHPVLVPPPENVFYVFVSQR